MTENDVEKTNKIEFICIWMPSKDRPELLDACICPGMGDFFPELYKFYGKKTKVTVEEIK